MGGGATSMGEAMDEPEVVFSSWMPWSGRAGLLATVPTPTMGVYVWARFATPPKPSARVYPDLPEELIYVGETNDLNIRPLGSRRHHRVANYVELFPDDPKLRKLYVAVCRLAPFRPQDPECHAWRALTRYLEARIAWEYTKTFRRRPLLDYKRGKDEFALPTGIRPNKRLQSTARASFSKKSREPRRG
jgi:hypothetical protein